MVGHREKRDSHDEQITELQAESDNGVAVVAFEDLKSKKKLRSERGFYTRKLFSTESTVKLRKKLLRINKNYAFHGILVVYYK